MKNKKALRENMDDNNNKVEFGLMAELRKEKFNPKKGENKKCIELEHINQVTGTINGYIESINQKSIKNVFRTGDVLFGKLRPYLKKYWLAEFNGVCSTEIWVFKPIEKICSSSKYLFYLVQSNEFIQATKVSSGSKMPRADWKYIINYPLSIVHSLPEQQKIAKILTTWDVAIDKLTQLITQKEKHKKGLMQVLLTGEVRFDGFVEEWKEVKLGECLKEKPKYGINAAAVKYNSNLPKYLRITDIKENGRFTKNNFVSVDNSDSSNFILKEGDIVFARTGNTTGKTYLYDLKDGELVYAGFLIKITPNKHILEPSFLKYFTETENYWNWIRIMSVRSGQPGVNGNEFKLLPLILPPLKEQQKIAATLTSADQEIGNLKTQLEVLQLQKKGLMQELLTGKTRVNLN